ncbi:MAG: hypothetical protein DRN92_00400 [Thermoproteota archaeon]|nr:MAG: hypothetical protein DRN92_00400 [Candidatus Korarchaeota archaeon]
MVERRIYLETHGCTMNRADSEAMLRILKESGFERTNFPEEADLIILNTCNVKQPTEQRMLSRTRALSLLNKPLIITGCMAATQPALLRRYAAALIGPKSIGVIADVAKKVLEGKKGIEVVEDLSLNKAEMGRIPLSKVSAVIPVAEGCLGQCTYCITRFARGRLRSYPPDSILRAIRSRINEGFKEVYLTAQDLGVYGWDIGTNIAKLLMAIRGIEGEFRVRVGMMNPCGVKTMVDELLESFSDIRIYKFFHIPVQSGSDRVLRLMKRGYGVKDFLEIVRCIRERYPISTIATDVIIGFPGETEDDFEQTLSLIREVKPEVVNISKFGPRPGTEAAEMKKLPTKIIKERSKIVSELCAEMKLKRNEQLVGKEFNVLVTEKYKEKAQGRTDFYRPVLLEQEVELGSFYRVEIVDARSNYLIGRVIELLARKEVRRPCYAPKEG